MNKCPVCSTELKQAVKREAFYIGEEIQLRNNMTFLDDPKGYLFCPKCYMVVEDKS